MFHIASLFLHLLRFTNKLIPLAVLCNASSCFITCCSSMLAAGAGARTTAGGGGAAAAAGGGVVGVAVGKERKKTMISAARGPKDG